MLPNIAFGMLNDNNTNGAIGKLNLSAAADHNRIELASIEILILKKSNVLMSNVLYCSLYSAQHKMLSTQVLF